MTERLAERTNGSSARILLARNCASIGLFRTLVIAAAACAVRALPAAAQSCGEVWTSVSDVPGTSAPVYAVLPLPDGQVLLAGVFNACKGVAANNIVRFDPATGVCIPMGQGVNGEVDAMTLLPDGDVLVGGAFTRAGGQPSARLARLSPATGDWTPIGPAPNGQVLALLTMPDGTVIVGGQFAYAGTSVLSNIGRFDPSSLSWDDLANGTAGDVLGGAVNSLARLPNGDVIAGGCFDFAGNVAAKCIARFRPSAGAWFPVGQGLGLTEHPSVDCLAVLPDGDLIAGGSVLPIGENAPTDYGLARYRFATESWVPTGALLLESPFIARVFGLGVTRDGNVLVAGSFNSASNVPAPGLVQFNPSDSTWTAPVNTSASWHRGTAVGILADGTAIVGGDFFEPGGLAARGVAEFDPASGMITPLATGIGGPVSLVQPLAGGDLIVCGTFDSIGGVPMHHVARYAPNTRSWTALADGTAGNVTAVAELASGKLVFGGSFTSIGGVAANSLAIHDPATGQWSELGGGVRDSSDRSPELRVRAIRELANGDIIVGGFFSTAGTLQIKNIARYTPGTNTWSMLGTGIDYWNVRAVDVLPGGDLIVGGSFTQAGGVTVINLARFTSATSSWSKMVSSVGTTTGLDTVSDILALPNGKFVIGGSFSRAAGKTASNIVILDPQASTISPLGAGVNGPVTGLALLPSGEVAVGGAFSQAGGLPAAQIARVNPATGVWTALNHETLTDNQAGDIAVSSAGDLFVGGSFAKVDGVVSYALARFSTHDAPSILVHPQSNRVCGRSGAVLGVVINEKPGDVSYQWRKNTTPIDPNLNPSAATATLSIARALPADAASYDCVITNPCGSVTSDPAELSVCVADIDCSGAVDLLDFFAWFNAWDTNDPLADVNDDAALDLSDFFGFFAAWDVSC